MTCSQQITLVSKDDHTYNNDITVTDIPKGYFITLTSNDPPEVGATIRTMQVSLMPAAWAEGGTNTVNSDLYVRQDGEVEVKAIVIQEGSTKCENTTTYAD